MLSSPYPLPPVLGWRPAVTLGYAATAAAGIIALSKPPVSYSTDTWVGIAWGLSLIIGGALAAGGTAFARYRFEWFGTFILAFGLATYAVMSWGQVIEAGIGHGPRALVLTGFALNCLARALLLGRIDKIAQEQKRSEATDRAGG